MVLKTVRSVFFAQKLLGLNRGPVNAESWVRPEYEFAVYVTNLSTSCNA